MVMISTKLLVTWLHLAAIDSPNSQHGVNAWVRPNEKMRHDET